MYKSLETLPIYNFWKICQTGDLRFLLKDNENIANQKELEYHWQIIFSQIQNIDLSIHIAYFETLKVYPTLEHSGDKGTCLKLFGKYRTILDKNYTNFKYANKGYKSCIDLYQDLVKSEASLIEMLLIFDPDVLMKTPLSESNIIEDCAALSKIIGFRLNPMEISVNEFESYKKIANEIVSANTK